MRQLYVGGELLGGCDIVDELAQTGALRSAVDEALAAPPAAAAAANGGASEVAAVPLAAAAAAGAASSAASAAPVWACSWRAQCVTCMLVLGALCRRARMTCCWAWVA